MGGWCSGAGREFRRKMSGWPSGENSARESPDGFLLLRLPGHSIDSLRRFARRIGGLIGGRIYRITCLLTG